MRKRKRNNRKVTAVLMAVLLALLTACSLGGHKITVVSGKDNIESIPKRAKAGETVTITTLSVTDAVMRCAVDDVAIEEVKDCVFEFVMPDHDVEVKVWVDTSGFSGA